MQGGKNKKNKKKGKINKQKTESENKMTKTKLKKKGSVPGYRPDGDTRRVAGRPRHRPSCPSTDRSVRDESIVQGKQLR